MDAVTEPPTAAWEALPGVEDAWTLLQRTGSGWSWRMVAVALTGGGLALRLAGVAPGLRIGTTFKVMGMARRAEYRAWLLARLADDRPRVLVPAHGEILAADDLADRLAALAHRRL